LRNFFLNLRSSTLSLVKIAFVKARKPFYTPEFLQKESSGMFYRQKTVLHDAHTPFSREIS